MLYEYEGIRDGVSRRTIQLDIQTMRSDKLGYNAPIIVVDKKYYTYETPGFSITQSKMSNQDLEKLNDVMRMLHQFKGFSYFEDVTAIIGKIEDKILQQRKAEVYIDFEKNELLKGLEWIDPLLAAVKSKTVLEVSYQSFQAKAPSQFVIHPYLLKEFRNRWFIFCKRQGLKGLSILALDRMHHVAANRDLPFHQEMEIDIQHFFDDVIGVTKSQHQQPETIVLEFNPSNAPYVITKPLHPSQQVLHHSDASLTISIEVVLNIELERDILGFGEGVKVLSPRILRNRVAMRLRKAAEGYHAEQ